MSPDSLNPSSSNLKAKSSILEFKDNSSPLKSDDILESFEANSAARTDCSNTWTIDVLPNMIPILIYVMLVSLRHAKLTDHREHAKSSVATICMYHMSIVYGYFLINDLFVRPSPSAHARNWSECSWKLDFVNFLKTLSVPEFLMPILSQFQAFQTERTKNVFFIPSAAGYDHNQFFGRVFPLNMFAAIHDCTANLPGNSTRIQVLQDLFPKLLYTITNPAYNCVIPDLIGVTIDRATNTTAKYINSKLYQTFNSVFNPVLFRDSQRRSALAALSFKAPVYRNAHINAYDMMFSATSANLRELKVVLQALTSLFKDKVVCKMTLSNFISETTSSSILKHGYSLYALPTWSHNENANKSALFAAITTFTLESESDRAADISFLQRPEAEIPHARNVRDVDLVATDAPARPIDLPANRSLVRHYPFDLRRNAEAQDGFPRVDNEDLVHFDDAIHTAPSVLVLDTDGTLQVAAHLATISGKIIESFELDGSTIEMPNAMKSLGMQNCMFADSAIAYKFVRPGSYYLPRAEPVLPPLNRAPPNSRPRLPASSLLYDRTMVMLPQFNPTINEAGPFEILPGFTQKSPVNVMRYAQSFLGFRTVDGSSNTAALDAVPGMTEGLLLVWSPYSYTPFESDHMPHPDLSASRHYFITNLRTIFGTDYNLVQLKHPYEALPAF